MHLQKLMITSMVIKHFRCSDQNCIHCFINLQIVVSSRPYLWSFYWLHYWWLYSKIPVGNINNYPVMNAIHKWLWNQNDSGLDEICICVNDCSNDWKANNIDWLKPLGLLSIVLQSLALTCILVLLVVSQYYIIKTNYFIDDHINE